MMVVLDTNVVLWALNQRHPFAVILNEWYAGRFVWALSTDILMEYREVIVRESGAARWRSLERLLDLAAAYRGNVQRVSPSFFFRTISADRDDDKFADCAIAANADFIVTSDTHFQPLIGSGLPTPTHHAGGVHRAIPEGETIAQGRHDPAQWAGESEDFLGEEGRIWRGLRALAAEVRRGAMN